jgi:uncharacterized protein
MLCVSRLTRWNSRVRMRCHIYKSRSKAGTYVYLSERDGFDCVPALIRESLGTLVFVMDLDLTPERKLARESAQTVMSHLGLTGFHLQLPPPLVPLLLETSDWRGSSS